MLEEFVRKENLTDKVVSIIELYDNPDDDIWFDNLLKQTGSFDVTVGNNPWNNGIIERHGIEAVTVGFFKRHILEGIQIRNLMENQKKWEDRVPDYLIQLIK